MCREFGVGNSTLQTIWKIHNESRIERIRKPERSNVDEALMNPDYGLLGCDAVYSSRCRILKIQGSQVLQKCQYTSINVQDVTYQIPQILILTSEQLKT
jgi:hypothetical protein